ncbi:hypothetical protein E2C01_051864 [Portunus trituberculatus]|uniref:Uncharacterized protein n=1 Tax=Portunus trituberculatus TaxID=210409 RepID=A0A5B7GMV3_PORTR|nr:hypothetical protein [Portunus trituberculatus]
MWCNAAALRGGTRKQGVLCPLSSLSLTLLAEGDEGTPNSVRNSSQHGKKHHHTSLDTVITAQEAQ